MGSSLREQLLKAGLADKSRLQRAKKQVRKQNRSGAAGGADTAAQAVAQAQTEKRARDRELNRQRELKKAAKARKALLKEFVERNKLNDASAQEPYNFVQGARVKRLFVNPRQRAQLGAGALAIAQVGGRYYLVSAEVGRKILEMVPGTFVFLPQQDKPADDDPYAEFQVPDDLMW
jgi:uncharacterized protein YaiL (DUF2058 family)